MDAEEEQTPVRRTRRSTAKAAVSPASKVSKPTTRKTKKKVVMMEVEVSDDEENSAPDTTLVSEDNKSESESESGKKIDKNESSQEEKQQTKVDDDFFVISEDNVDATELNDEKSKENGTSVNEDISEKFLKSESESANETSEKEDDENNEQDKTDNKLQEIPDQDIEKNGNEEKEETVMEVDEETKIETESNDLKTDDEDDTEDTQKKEENSENESGKEESVDEEKEEVEEEKEEVEEEKEKEESNSKIEEEKMETDEDKDKSDSKEKSKVKETEDPDTENISEDELPTVQAVKVPETEEVSDEELPGPKRAELPADTEVVSEDELPTVKKDEKTGKRKMTEGDYDPSSPTSENETPAAKKTKEDKEQDGKEKEEKATKPKKLPELDKFWKAVNDDPTDFTGWTYLLQYVDQENDMEAAREAYDAFLSHYPYCYGYWRKYADYEKRKGNKKKCEEVFERGLKAIPLSVDLWLHYLNYVKSTRQDDEDYVRSQFDRALQACGLEFRSDRLWDSFIKWETEGKRLQRVTGIFDKLLATPTQGYTAHFESFQEHVSTNPPNKVLEVDEFLALRKEVKSLLKHETTEANSDAPPGDEDLNKIVSSDEETKLIRERIISIRRKIHKNTVTAVSARWNFEEGIKRPYFHVKPLERCQLKNWHDYLDYEIQQGDKARTIVLFERCLIACALYEEFWLKFIHYLNSLKEDDVIAKMKDVYERACTIHHLKKPNLHLQWAVFEESNQNASRAAEILVNLEKCVPNLLQIAQRRINLERRRGDNEKCCQLYEHYISGAKNKAIASYHAVKYSRFQLKTLKNYDKAVEILKSAVTKDATNPRLHLQLIDLTLQKPDVGDADVIALIDAFVDKESVEIEQKLHFAQRKLEYLEDFGADIAAIQKATEDYQKLLKSNKDAGAKRKDSKADPASSKKEKTSTPAAAQSGPYPYGGYNASGQSSYQYSGNQPQGQYGYQQYGQNEQYPYQNWQYPQGGYGGYNQWGGYGGGYGY